ncbi:hypothetical protein EVAR_27834_1 [Eumeta japonica]|uniref:Uncharacterized protein n=1 Tax=Eumeta variegata TaxID=151549 RepID=A0A4C1VK22_EUMVA|nr:hypothetical protein EVAR_27834_1 [Eumeta japonica]
MENNDSIVDRRTRRPRPGPLRFARFRRVVLFRTTSTPPAEREHISRVPLNRASSITASTNPLTFERSRRLATASAGGARRRGKEGCVFLKLVTAGDVGKKPSHGTTGVPYHAGRARR